MTGHVFGDGQDPLGQMTARHGSSDGGDLRGISPVAAVFQERMRAVRKEVANRGAVGVDAHVQQFAGDQAGAQFHRADGIGAGGLHKVQRGRPFGPMGAAQALHAADLLIDQNRCIAAHSIPQVGGEAPQLCGVLHITGEQDEAEGLIIGKEGAFVGQQDRAGATEDGCAVADCSHL